MFISNCTKKPCKPLILLVVCLQLLLAKLVTQRQDPGARRRTRTPCKHADRRHPRCAPGRMSPDSQGAQATAWLQPPSCRCAFPPSGGAWSVPSTASPQTGDGPNKSMTHLRRNALRALPRPPALAAPTAVALRARRGPVGVVDPGALVQSPRRRRRGHFRAWLAVDLIASISRTVESVSRSCASVSKFF